MSNGHEDMADTPKTDRSDSLLDQLKEREHSVTAAIAVTAGVASGAGRILLLSPSLSPHSDGHSGRGKLGSRSPDLPEYHYADKATQTPTQVQLTLLYRSSPTLPRSDTSVYTHQQAHDILPRQGFSASPRSLISSGATQHLHARGTETSPRNQSGRNPYRRDYYPTPVTVTNDNPPRLPHLRLSDLPRLKPQHELATPTQHRSASSGRFYPAYHRSHHIRTISDQHTSPAHHPRLYSHPYEQSYTFATQTGPRSHAQEAREMYYLHRGLPSPQVVRRVINSPSSETSPSESKAPRKRADDGQLQVLIDVFERTAYPSTEEREYLAKKLGMTSRSVQIWFQNRRRAVKVDRQSAIQRAEAASGSENGDVVGGEMGFGRQQRGIGNQSLWDRGGGDAGGREYRVKREVFSPRGGVDL